MNDKPTISDMMVAYAQDAVDFAQAKFGETLDYSERSVQKVERCLRQLYDAKPMGFLGKLFAKGPSDEDVLTVAKMFGGYVGEVVRRHHGGDWVLDEETYPEHAVIAIHHPASIMNAMDEWNTRHHGNSGLTERVRQSDSSTADAERETLAFLRRYVPPGKSPMCGNSICQDRRFMARLMPELEAFFHYRNLDVSTLKELARLWKPELASGFVKKGAHLALDDILESIDEMKYYREHFIRC